MRAALILGLALGLAVAGCSQKTQDTSEAALNSAGNDISTDSNAAMADSSAAVDNAANATGDALNDAGHAVSNAGKDLKD